MFLRFMAAIRANSWRMGVLARPSDALNPSPLLWAPSDGTFLCAPVRRWSVVGCCRMYAFWLHLMASFTTASTPSHFSTFATILIPFRTGAYRTRHGTMQSRQRFCGERCAATLICVAGWRMGDTQDLFCFFVKNFGEIVVSPTAPLRLRGSACACLLDVVGFRVSRVCCA